ncbi:MAG TPA: ethanolamine ammonia-lyase subunit EutC [Burkholderiales bacterium]|jgi:ethanolamine ammonia-lyase small subunit|nr:ethanolamine ammonia-lyase subunit EutC [Burkholderiales bacterium]
MPPPPKAPLCRPDPWRALGRFTSARIGLGRAGGSLPTAPLLEFQLCHARARDAVQRDLDAAALETSLRQRGFEVLQLATAAPDRRAFIRRPDQGRILSPDSRALLEGRARCAEPFDAVFVIADGLSALAVEHHAAALLGLIAPRLIDPGWHLAPVCVVRQGRVAVADEIGALLPARMSVMLIGERPGLTSPDSLGIYLTWEPLPGRSNAERNCISNVRPEGLHYARAAHKLFHLMSESRRLRLSGVGLKEDAPALPGEGNELAPGATDGSP